MNFEKVDKAAEITGLQINVNKMKSLVFGRENIDQRLHLDQTEVENVQEFVNLGSLLTWDMTVLRRQRTGLGKPVEQWQNCERQKKSV